MGFSLALLGAGYLVGLVGGIAILLGIVLAWGVAVPYFTAASPMPADADMIGYAMSIWKTKVRFIGVGTIGIAAIWTLLILLKPMVEGMSQSLRKLSEKNLEKFDRTSQDLSPKAMGLVLLGSIVLIVLALYEFVQPASLAPEAIMLLIVVCTLLAVVIGFLVAAACGYMAGLVGSSSSPISGIGIISVVVTSLVLMAIGHSFGLMDTPEGQKFLTALTIFTCSIVITTAAISNDNLQDLKTGQLVEATPWRQQVALIIGCIVGAFVISPVLELLFNAYGFTGAMPREGLDASQALSAPQATLMMTISNGMFSSNLEWAYIFPGSSLGAVLIVIDAVLKKSSNGKYALPVLAVGMGIYLPPVVNAPLVVGALLAWFINRHIENYAHKSGKDAELVKKKAERYGTLFAAGLIVGESLIGVLLAFIIAGSVTSGGSDAPLALELENWGGKAEVLGLVAFVVGILIYTKRVMKAKQ